MDALSQTREAQAAWSTAKFYAYVETFDGPLPGTPSGRPTSSHPPESKEDKRFLVILDSISADWADMNLSTDATNAIRAADKAPVAIIVVELPNGLTEKFVQAEIQEQAWLEVQLGPTGTPATLFADLDGPAFPVAILDIKRLPWARAKQLAESIGLGFAHDAPRDVISAALSGRASSYLAVYDVGQGNCNALCDSAPTWYFDFGGGCLWNARTYPVPLRFCFKYNPPIVLSHWDFDHWFSAAKNDRAKAALWIVPRQTIGPRTWKFAAELYLKGSFRVWGGIDRVAVPDGEIVRCTGPESDKNSSGLAAVVSLKAGTGLLPGDAAYSRIPKCPNTLSALVAMHHGSHKHL